jgi:pimeloyl-ACP methyl ester carboxylesterase
MGQEQLTLLTHSMGAALAYAYLSQHPTRVKGLVLISPVLPTEYSASPNMEFVRKVWPEADSALLVKQTAAFYAGLGERALRVLHRERLVPDSLRHLPWDSLDLAAVLSDRERTNAWRINFMAANSCTADNWRSMEGGQVFHNSRVGRFIARGQDYQQRTAQFWEALRQFRGPVHVIIGTCDYVDIGPTVWPRALALLANGAFSTIQGTGHNSWLDQPLAFSRALGEALGRATPVAAVLPPR